MGVQCCKVAEDISGFSGQKGAVELSTRSVDELSSAIISTMRVELRLRCEKLPQGILDKEKAVISYKIEYAGTQQIVKHSQNSDSEEESKFSNACILSYEMGTNKIMRITIYISEAGKDSTSKITYGTINLNLDEIILDKSHEIKREVTILEKEYADSETLLVLHASEKKQEL